MTPEEKSALIRATFRIFCAWQIDDVQASRILNEPDWRQLKRWRLENAGAPTDGVIERMAIILTIHASLRRLYRDPERGYAWMQRPNIAFEDQSPIAMIAAGGDEALLRLKSHLDAEAQAW